MLKNKSVRGISGNTKISLLDGSNVTIKEIFENYSYSNPNYIYAFGKDGITLEKAIRPKLVGKNINTLIIVLDSGKSICCSPDFRFLSRHGEGIYKRARYLRPQQGLMPIYKGVGNNGYENFYDPIKGKFIDTHRMVLKKYYNLDSMPADCDVHHKKSKTNNDPRELELLFREYHNNLHDKKEPKNLCLEHFKGDLSIINNPEKLLETAMDSISINDIKYKLNITKKIINWTLNKWDIPFKDFCSLIAKRRQYFNHKVVEILPGPVSDIYNITVKKTGNFALSAGVFVSCS